MTQGSQTANAWRVTPEDYLAGRPPAGDVPVAARPKSCYVTMRDGVRIAIDIHLPPDHTPSDPIPAILVLTPYYRRFLIADGAPPTEACPNVSLYRDAFVPRGYALVVADTRGTGASEGVREGFRSPLERDDYRELASWIVAQDWSDGRIGATGISYLGAAADFFASTGHPAIKAIAPLFSVWDTYSNHYYPGGILLNRLSTEYEALMVGLDHDDRTLLKAYAAFGNSHFRGPAPVDEDVDGTLLAAAIAQHRSNFRMPDFIREFRFKGEGLPYDAAFTSDSFSPCAYAENVRSDVAVYSVSGWMDGGGFSNGAISRFLSLPNAKHHLLLGPWDHGARSHCSPFRDRSAPPFPLMGELLRFFDHYLKGMATGLDRESRVHYYTIGAEDWRESGNWPPAGEKRMLHLAAGSILAHQAGTEGAETHAVDFSIGSGEDTRYERLAAREVHEYYASWNGRDADMLCFTSPPLGEPIEVSGHPILDIAFQADQSDCALHVYLEQVAPDGTAWYVTEGVLRALHRKTTAMPQMHRTVGPYRSFSRADAEPLPPGEICHATIALLPTSWLFPARHRVRLAISGADADHYMQVPHGRPPVLTVRYGGTACLELPLGAGGRQ